MFIFANPDFSIFFIFDRFTKLLDWVMSRIVLIFCVNNNYFVNFSCIFQYLFIF